MRIQTSWLPVIALLMGCAAEGGPGSGPVLRSVGSSTTGWFGRQAPGGPGARFPLDTLPESEGGARAVREGRADPGGVAPQEGTATAAEIDPAEIRRAVEAYLAERDAGKEEAPFARVLEKLAIFGDLRLRQEASFHLDDQDDRHRSRVRARLGASYPVTDEVLVGGRMVTGDRGDPNSPHVTLGSGFDGFEISLDRAFATYRPGWLEGVALTAGKFSHGFTANPVYGELVWDADVQPEGAEVSYDVRGDGWFQAGGVRVAEYVLLEQGNAKDATATAGQVTLRVNCCDPWFATAAFGYYYYTDTTPDGSRAILADNAGNATRDLDTDGLADQFVSDFGILHPLLAVEYRGFAVPVQVAAEYMHNHRARGDRDSGWAAGVAVGGAARQGDWRSYYQYQLIEQDAVFSPFAQDDFLFATNHRSHVVGAGYQLTDKVGLHLWGLISQLEHRLMGPTTDSDRHQWRIRLDLNIKF